MKNIFNKNLVVTIAEAISSAYPSFNSKKFITVASDLNRLEMKARVQAIRDALRLHLPKDYSQAIKVLLASIEAKKLQGFVLWPLTEYVQTFGLEHREISLLALKEMTKSFTSEWAVRPFLLRFPKETLDFLETCAQDHDVHVRRFASEGSRPRLPWGERLDNLIDDPGSTLKILEHLKDDPELYVRKSVANHLNDITKDHPQIVLKLLHTWRKTTEPQHKNKLDWTIRHSLRSLIKKGDIEALGLLGVSKHVKIELSNFALTKGKIKLGESLQFSFDLVSTSKNSQKLVVDYVLHLVKANQRRSAKVFKLRTLTIDSMSRVFLNKKHAIKKITTRTYYPGEQLLEIQVNGQKLHRCVWTLER